MQQNLTQVDHAPAPTYGSKPSIGGNKFDLAKFVMAVLILCLHSGVFPDFFFLVFRLAVPLFFMITAYFFFNKMERAEREKRGDKKVILLNFVQRNVCLYWFWTIVFIVPILIQRKWFEHEFPYSILLLLRSLFFGSTFRASWFITATVIAAVLICVLSYKCRLKDTTILLIGVCIYLLCCLDSNYFYLIPGESVFCKCLMKCHLFFGSPVNSFPVAIVWMMFGKRMVNRQTSLSVKTLFLWCIVAFLMLCLEYLVICHWRLSRVDDCYISLLFLCPLMMELLIKMRDFPLYNPIGWRKMSIVIFCTHGTFMGIIRRLLEQDNMLLPIVVFAICCMIGFLVMRMEGKVRVLQYAT